MECGQCGLEVVILVPTVRATCSHGRMRDRRRFDFIVDIHSRYSYMYTVLEHYTPVLPDIPMVARAHGRLSGREAALSGSSLIALGRRTSK